MTVCCGYILADHFNDENLEGFYIMDFILAICTAIYREGIKYSRDEIVPIIEDYVQFRLDNNLPCGFAQLCQEYQLEFYPDIVWLGDEHVCNIDNTDFCIGMINNQVSAVFIHPDSQLTDQDLTFFLEWKNKLVSENRIEAGLKFQIIS